MKHIWDAIDLCQRKLINELERLETPGAPVAAATVATSAAATLDRTASELEEIHAELRAVTAARRDFKDLYGEPVNEGE